MGGILGFLGSSTQCCGPDEGLVRPIGKCRVTHFFLGQVSIGLVEAEQNQISSRFIRRIGLIRAIEPKADSDEPALDVCLA